MVIRELPPPPPPPSLQPMYPKKKRTRLYLVSIALVAILVVASLFYFAILPSLKPREELRYPETAWMGGLTDPSGNLVVNGQTTTEKVMTIKGNVTNPSASSTGSLSIGNVMNSGISLVGTTRMSIRSLQQQQGVFNGKVVLWFNGQERFLEVYDIADPLGGPDLWRFEGKLVLVRGENTFQILVQDANGNIVGQSRQLKVIANIPLTAIRINLTWDTNKTDMDLHIWHFPWIDPAVGTGGMDGLGNWWQWFGYWGDPLKIPWQFGNPWISNFTLANYNALEAFTWRNYSYTYGGQLYNYGDGVGHAWYSDKVGITGGMIDIDDVNGFGPEVFTMLNARPGLYVVVARMYDPHDNNRTTNAQVYVELFEQAKGTFSHSFEPIDHGDSVIQYPPTYGTLPGDFPQAWVTDWEAYNFYILPDNTVSATKETDDYMYADCRVSAPMGSIFRDRWFLIDHSVTVSNIRPGGVWASGGWSVFRLERLGEAYGGYEAVMIIDEGGVAGTQESWQGTNINIPPGLYRLSLGKHVEGDSATNLNIRFLSARNV